VEILNAEQCAELLLQMPIGRIGISIGALPVILPVNYSMDGDAIVFRTIRGTKLAAATSKTVVAFEVDSYENDGRSGWSVLVQGIASEVTDPRDLEREPIAALEAWALAERADHVVRIWPQIMSGRRFSHRRGAR
jgi:nitroimidazol reductase NimA-like FMN-containing flavoprotein (pyridoxamine 5'-phosphate oxidase superfamily)